MRTRVFTVCVKVRTLHTRPTLKRVHKLHTNSPHEEQWFYTDTPFTLVGHKLTLCIYIFFRMINWCHNHPTHTHTQGISKEDFDSVITYDKDTLFTVMEGICRGYLIMKSSHSEYLKMVSTGVNLCRSQEKAPGESTYVLQASSNWRTVFTGLKPLWLYGLYKQNENVV